MAKLGPKGQDECRRGAGGRLAPQKLGECLVLICALWSYAALFHPVVECILNLQGLFKSEVPVVIFLHLVLKIK